MGINTEMVKTYEILYYSSISTCIPLLININCMFYSMITEVLCAVFQLTPPIVILRKNGYVK